MRGVAHVLRSRNAPSPLVAHVLRSRNAPVLRAPMLMQRSRIPAMAPRVARRSLLVRIAGFSTAPMPPEVQQQPGLTMEMALSITNATHMQLDKGLQGGHLDQIREMLNVYLSTLINNVVPLGFSANQQGLIAYNHHFTGLMASSSPQTEELKALYKKVWQTLLQRAFNVDFDESIDLNRAREIQGRLAYGLQSADFLKKVDALKERWKANSVTQEEQHAALLSVILDGQMETMPEFGYHGEAGYVQMQAQLMEHANDPIIMNNTTAATMTVFERAGISLQ